MQKRRQQQETAALPGVTLAIQVGIISCAGIFQLGLIFSTFLRVFSGEEVKVLRGNAMVRWSGRGICVLPVHDHPDDTAPKDLPALDSVNERLNIAAVAREEGSQTTCLLIRIGCCYQSRGRICFETLKGVEGNSPGGNPYQPQRGLSIRALLT